MPDHSTWFRFLPFYESLVRMIWAESGTDRSWVAGVPYGAEHVLGAALVVLVLILFSLLVRAKVADVKEAVIPDPKFSLRTIAELLIEVTLGLMSGLRKPKEARYFLPLIGTCAFFILFSNLLGLVPGFAPPTATLDTTAACAVVIFFATHIYGVKAHGAKYIMHFFGPVVPTKDTPIYAVPFILVLMGLMFLIEIVSHLARPLSLSLRLMGNMFGDHTVVAIFTVIVPMVPLIVPLPVMALGIFVCFVQTLVFCMLSIIYIALAIEHAEEH